MAKAKKTDDSAAPNPDATAPEGGDTEVQIAGGVKMKVTTKGHGKIHTGEFIRGTHVPITYNKGDAFLAPDQDAAALLMDRGLADTTE